MLIFKLYLMYVNCVLSVSTRAGLHTRHRYLDKRCAVEPALKLNLDGVI